MTHLDALLRAVLEEPGEDAPRLVYADLLEEAGQAERARYIRVRVEWDRLPDCGHDWLLSPGGWACPTCRRKDELKAANTNEDGLPFWEKEFRNWVEPCGRFQPAMRRGFVHAITLTAADFLAHAADVFRAQPVEAVTLTGKRPLRSEGDAVARWTHDPRQEAEALSWQIPADVFVLLPTGAGANCCLIRDAGEHRYSFSVRDYDTDADALAALSAAAVAYARAAAGLSLPAPA